MTVHSDLAGGSEDDRITIIGKTATRGAIVGFIVEDDAKADRYIDKIMTRFTRVHVIDRKPGPVAGTILVRIGPQGH